MRHCFQVMVFVMLVLLAISPLQAMTIHLLPEVNVGKTHFTLGEISRVQGENEPLNKRLRNMIIGNSPVPGYRNIYTLTRIITIVENKMPELKGRLDWRGSEKVSLQGIGIEYSVQQYRQIAERFLRQHLEERYQLVKLKAVGIQRNIMIPQGEVKFKPRLPEKSTLSRRMAVWLDVYLDGQDHTTLPVWFEVSASSEVLVINKQLMKQQVINRTDVSRELRDLTTVKGQVLEQWPDQQIWATTALSSNSVLTDKSSAIKPSVIKGQSVQVQVMRGVVQITTTGKAQQSGLRGDVIEVLNTRSQERYKAKIIGSNVTMVMGQ